MRFQDYDGDGSYEPVPGVWADLEWTGVGANAIYTVTAGNQNVFVFNGNGQITAHIDPRGNQTTFSYTDVLTRVTGPSGERWLDFAYNGQGLLTSVTDHTGRSTSYGYDNENLAAVTDTLDHVWTYTYTGTHLLHEVVNPDSKVVERTFYDAENRAVRQENGLDDPVVEIEYLADGVHGVTENGKTVTDTYDAWNTLISQVDSEGNARTYTFDEHFNRATSTDAQGTTWFDRDRYGFARSVTDAEDQVTTIEYDEYHNVTVITNAMNEITTFAYDGNNLESVTNAETEETSFTYNGQGQVTSVTVSDTITTDYEYDLLGQLVEITDPMNGVTTIDYDPVGRPVTVVQAVGTALEQRTVYAYDDGDRLTRTVVNQVDGVYDSDYPDEDLVTQYQYDAAGRLTHVTDHLGRVTFQEYDAAGQLVKVWENYHPPYNRYESNQYNLITEYGYDPAGNLTWITDTLGNVTYTEYDGLNRPFRVTENYSTTEGADTNIVTQYAYDAAGNVEWITDPLDRVTHQEYDALGRLITVTVNYTTTPGADPNQYNLVTVYGYNVLGWQTSVTDPRGKTTSYDHDQVGRVTKITDPEGGEAEFAYNPLGLRTMVEDGEDVTTRYAYDDLGRLTRTWDELGNTTQYAYDALGNRTSMTDAENVVTRYEYDAVGRLTAVVENYLAGQPETHEQNVRTEYAYDGAGNLAEVTDARGYATTYAYDLLDRLLATTDPLNQITSYVYGEALGDPTQRHQPGSVDTGYTYDHLGRMTYAQYQDRGVAYMYDKVGNLLAMAGTDGHHRTITRDAVGRPVHVEEDVSTFEDTFDTLDGSQWVFNTYQSIEDGTLKNVGTGSSYTANLRRSAYTISEGEGIRIAFKVSQGDTIAHFGLENSDGGTYRRWAVIANGNKLWVQTNDGSGYQWAADLINPVQTDTWYVLVLKADEDGWFSAEVWQKDDPSVRGVYSGQLAADLDWRFHHWIYRGTAWMDDYREFTYHTATRHAYDAVGNRTGLGYSDTSVTYAYDDANRLTSVSGWGSQVTYGYDDAGRLLTTMRPNGIVTAYDYDDAGRLTDITHDNAYWELASYHYVLDGLGNRVQAVERVLPPTPVQHLPIVMRDYEDGGALMSLPESSPAVPETFRSPLPVEPLVPETFRSPVEPTEEEATPTPSASVPLSQWDYSSLGSAKNGNAVFGAAGGFAPLAWLRGAFHWLADGASKVWRALFSPGDTIQHTPLTFTSPIGGQSVGDEVTINYTYDDLYRLTNASYSTGSTYTYAYDKVGNRTAYSGPDGSHSYQYDDASRLTWVDSTQYTYDPRGNLTSDGTRTYAWDGAGRLAGVSQGGTTTSYTYAGDGVRLAKTVGSQRTTFVQDVVRGLPNVLAESTGNATTHYLLGLSQIAQTKEGQTQWLLGDGLGSVRQAVNEQGHIVLTRSYSPFGKVLGEEGDIPTSFGFAGEQADPIGSVFLRARYYSPSIGRFVSQDPFPGFLSMPGTLHTYAYCLNDPVNCTDPSGEYPPWVREAAAFAAGAISQYGNDMLWGVPDRLAGQMDMALAVAALGPYSLATIPTALAYNTRLYEMISELAINPCSEAYQRGQSLGRLGSTIHGAVETVMGVTIFLGAMTLGPPLIVGAALAGGGAASLATGGAALAVNVAALGVGGALAAHGAGVLMHNVGNPLSSASNATANGQTQSHHIISPKTKKYSFQNHPAVRESGIDILNDPDNLVDLPSPPHQGRHTYKYHDYIQERLDELYEEFGGTQELGPKLREELGALRRDLLSGKLDPYMK